MPSPIITPSATQQLNAQAMQRLLDIMYILRQQCPWDIKQTPLSLSKYAIEEAYEVADAIAKQLPDSYVSEELGDLLLQVVFQAELYAERTAFDINTIIHTLSEKLIRRHPHVFDKTNYPAQDTDAVNALWQQIKAAENAAKTALLPNTTPPASLLGSVSLDTSLRYAQSLQAKAATVGFDWPTLSETMAKVYEELTELESEIDLAGNTHNLPASKGTPAHAALTDELGDCLFALVNVARKLGVNSEDALNSTIAKFNYRFSVIEQALANQGTTLTQASLAEMDAIWNAAKET